MEVRAKKALGQHFLTDMRIAGSIVDALVCEGAGMRMNVLEVGPGMGVLSGRLLERKELNLKLVEIDGESVEYLKKHFPGIDGRLIQGDFLKMDLRGLFGGEEIPGQARNDDEKAARKDGRTGDGNAGTMMEEKAARKDGEGKEAQFAVIGNFPYNISSQIFFKILDHKDLIPQVVCMIQKEVAERIAEKPGSKTYGILSVLLQAWYDIEYLFTVGPGCFAPPPKVHSAVIRLRRNGRTDLGCDEALFKRVVKAAFGQRRKTLRNSLKPLWGEVAAKGQNRQDGLGRAEKPARQDDKLEASEFFADPVFDLRPERLSVEDFVALTRLFEGV